MTIQQATRAVPRADLGQAFWEYDPTSAGLIGMQLLGEFPTQLKASTFSKITRESILKRAKTRREGNAAYNRINLFAEDGTYACQENGLEGALGDPDRALYASDFDAEQAIVRHTTLKVLLEQEIRIKDLLFNAGTYTGADLYTDVSSAPWDAAASDAIAHVTAASEKVRQNTGMRPNTLAIGAATAINLLSNTGIKARFLAVPVLTRDVMATNLGAIFGVPRVLIGGQVYDSADEGLDFSAADVWADDYAWVGLTAAPLADLLTPCVGRTFRWTADAAENVVVEQYREEQTRSDILRVRQHTDEVLIDKYFGHLLKVDA